jgi:hypothetical protein
MWQPVESTPDGSVGFPMRRLFCLQESLCSAPKPMEDRKQTLIEEFLQQKAAA